VVVEIVVHQSYLQVEKQRTGESDYGSYSLSMLLY
jgi:hypothetical protein